MTKKITTAEDSRISENLKKLISDSPYTLNELANILDVSPNSVNNWVGGKTLPMGKSMSKLRALFRVSMYQLQGKEPLVYYEPIGKEPEKELSEFEKNLPASLVDALGIMKDLGVKEITLKL